MALIWFEKRELLIRADNSIVYVLNILNSIRAMLYANLFNNTPKIIDLQNQPLYTVIIMKRKIMEQMIKSKNIDTHWFEMSFKSTCDCNNARQPKCRHGEWQNFTVESIHWLLYK